MRIESSRGPAYPIARLPVVLPEPVSPSRRSLLRAGAYGALGLGVGALAGCDVPALTPSAQKKQATNADLPAVVSAAALSRRLIDLTASTGRHQHSLEGRMAPLTAMHRAHLRVLEHAVPQGQRSRLRQHKATVTPKHGSGLAAVRAAETLARTQLASLANTAHSGELARLLASMAAAIGQQLQELGR